MSTIHRDSVDQQYQRLNELAYSARLNLHSASEGMPSDEVAEYVKKASDALALLEQETYLHFTHYHGEALVSVHEHSRDHEYFGRWFINHIWSSIPDGTEVTEEFSLILKDVRKGVGSQFVRVSITVKSGTSTVVTEDFPVEPHDGQSSWSAICEARGKAHEFARGVRRAYGVL